ncbi:MAG: hypothetical protein ACI976_000572, partial [Aureispira sp.]
MSLDEHDEIEKLESSWSLTKRQEEGFVSFSAGSGDYSWGKILWIAFLLMVFSLLLFAMFFLLYETITDESLVKKLGGTLVVSLLIIGLFSGLYRDALTLHEEILELIHFNTYLVLTRDYLEVYWFPLRILKQKILIKDIKSIDIQWQQFFWRGKKIPIEELIKKLGKDKYDIKGYSSFNVNLHNKKTKTLNLKLREISVAEQLSSYILNSQQFLATNYTVRFGTTVFENKDKKLEIYSSTPLSKEKTKDYRGELKMLFKILSIFFLLTMVGRLEFLFMGSFMVLMMMKDFFILLKNARIKKITVTPSLLAESRIGLFSNSKNRFEFTKEAIDSFFVKQQESSQKYNISIILKTGVSHDLFIEFKERKIAEELIEKIKIVLANENKIYIDSESNSS